MRPDGHSDITPEANHSLSSPSITAEAVFVITNPITKKYVLGAASQEAKKAEMVVGDASKPD